MDLFSHGTMLYYDTSWPSIACILCDVVDLFKLYGALVFADWVKYIDSLWVFEIILYLNYNGEIYRIW